jgi:hypothetical protein
VADPERRSTAFAVRDAAATSAYRRAVVILLLGMAMAGLFVVSYVDALGRPTARTIDVAVVGDSAASDPVALALQQGTSKGVRLTPYPSRDVAEAAVARQETYAVLLLQPGQPPALELSSASGSSVARALTQAAASAQKASGEIVQLSDLHPLPTTDPSGLAEFYLVLAATILGFVGTFQLRANAKPLALGPWLGFTGALAAFGSLLLVLLVRHALGIPIPLLRSWAVVGMQMATASAFAATMAVLIGRWALLPTWLLFVVLGNTSSGGAVSSALLPEPFRALSRSLPSGASVTALRTGAYFPGDQPTSSLLVLVGWTVLTVGGLLVACLTLRRSPGED